MITQQGLPENIRPFTLPAVTSRVWHTTTSDSQRIKLGFVTEVEIPIIFHSLRFSWFRVSAYPCQFRILSTRAYNKPLNRHTNTEHNARKQRTSQLILHFSSTVKLGSLFIAIQALARRGLSLGTALNFAQKDAILHRNALV
jgi:hypothetical protein